MVTYKRNKPRPSKKDAKNSADRIVEEERVTSTAKRTMRTILPTREVTGATNKKPTKNSVAPELDKEWDPENASLPPTEARRRSKREIRLTEKVMALPNKSTHKPKAPRPQSKAPKPMATGKQILGKADSNREHAEISSVKNLKGGDHRANGNRERLAGGREADLERENDELKRIIRSLEAQAKDQDMDETIAKRTGSVGSKGYKLLVSMELVHDKNLYKRILRSVRDLCHEARVDFGVPYSDQSMSRLGKLFAAAAEREPYLKRFHNDWATGQIVRQFINSRRKYERRKAKKALAMVDSDEENRFGGIEDEGSGDDDYFGQRRKNDGNASFDNHWRRVVGEGEADGREIDDMKGKNASDDGASYYAEDDRGCSSDNGRNDDK